MSINSHLLSHNEADIQNVYNNSIFSNDSKDEESNHTEDLINYLDMTSPSDAEIQQLLLKHKCTNADIIAQKYDEYVNNIFKWNIIDLLQDLQLTKSKLVDIEFVNIFAWNNIQCIVFKLMLINYIKDKNSSIVPVIELLNKQKQDKTKQKQNEIEEQQQEFENKVSQSEVLQNYINAYQNITVTSALMFGFGISLASDYLTDDSIKSVYILHVFHIAISISIISSLHSLIVTTWIIYNMYRSLGAGNIEYCHKYLSATYGYRQETRITFILSLGAFAAALGILYYDSLPIYTAITNTGILSIGAFVIGLRVFRPVKVYDKDGTKVTSEAIWSMLPNKLDEKHRKTVNNPSYDTWNMSFV